MQLATVQPLLLVLVVAYLLLPCQASSPTPHHPPASLLSEALQLLGLSAVSEADAQDQAPLQLAWQLHGSGAHRALQYTIHSLDTPPGQSRCSLLQHLPSVVCADPYELEQLQALQGSPARFSIAGDVDLEQPAPACNDTLLVVVLTPAARGQRQLPQEVEVPLHSKYPRPVHTPGQGAKALLSGYAALELPPPWLVCHGTDQHATAWQIQPQGPALVWQIPTGSLAHLHIVATVTAAAVVASCVWLVRSLWTAGARLDVLHAPASDRFSTKLD